MSERIRVTMTLDLIVEDAAAMHEAAFERLRGAWSSDEDFPYESAADLGVAEVVHSLLADALPAELPGCRRSQLEVQARSDDDSHPPSHEDEPPAEESPSNESSSEEEATTEKPPDTPPEE